MGLNAYCTIGPLCAAASSTTVARNLVGDPGQESSAPSLTTACSRERTRRFKPMKILIAEDNRLMLEGLRRALDRVEDIELVGATHAGEHVLPLVERRRPEVVALEIGLRAADGRACLDLIHEQHPDVTLVVLSAPIDTGTIRSALARGA